MLSRTSHRGFTILEILVVIAIVSLVITSLLLNTQFRDPADALKRHGRELSQMLQLLSQEAVFENRNFAINIQPNRYILLQYDGTEWVPSDDKFFKKLLKEHPYADELIIDKQLVDIKKTDKPEPHILILSSGEMTVFEWLIRDRENQLTLQLLSSFQGDIQLTGPEDTTL